MVLGFGFGGYNMGLGLRAYLDPHLRNVLRGYRVPCKNTKVYPKAATFQSPGITYPLNPKP